MPVFRYRGQFVSESRARQLSHLKGASQYVTSTPTKEEGRKSAEALAKAESTRRSEAMRRSWERRREEAARETARRSEAAKRAWAEKKAEQARRSAAARKGWDTRRQKAALEVPPRPVYPEGGYEGPETPGFPYTPPAAPEEVYQEFVPISDFDWDYDPVSDEDLYEFMLDEDYWIEDMDEESDYEEVA